MFLYMEFFSDFMFDYSLPVYRNGIDFLYIDVASYNLLNLSVLILSYRCLRLCHLIDIVLPLPFPSGCILFLFLAFFFLLTTNFPYNIDGRGKSRHTCLVPDLTKRKAFSPSPLSMML